MKTNSTSLSGILGVIAILAGISVPATAQTYTTFDADPHATLPHRIDSTGESWKHLLRQPGLWRIRTQTPTAALYWSMFRPVSPPTL